MQRPLYDQLVPYYELIEGRDWHREIKLVTSILRKHRSSSVIDLGCGTGYHVRELAKVGFDATGVDISRENIRFARRKAVAWTNRARFVLGSYYRYRPRKSVDAALCLNWSIPTVNSDIRRFLSNARLMLRMGGVLILDYERVSEIAWKDVGKPIVNAWNVERLVIVRVSVGQVVSNVLHSRDVYTLFPESINPNVPAETARYRAVRNLSPAKVYVDCSYVRFFSVPELRQFALRAGFRMVANHVLPRNGYKRNYAVLERIS